MTHVIAIALQKGGVGKTTSAAALGAELASTGARVLVVDLDPQGNLTEALGYDPDACELTVYEVLLNPQHDPSFAVLPTAYGPDLIAANISLEDAELTFSGRIGREMLLKQALAPLLPRYDYVFLDCPRNLGLLAINALAAADTILVPLQAQPYAKRAMKLLGKTVTTMQQVNAPLHIGGIVVTMVDARTAIGGAIEDWARGMYGDLVFRQTIPQNVRVAEAPAARQPIGVYAPESQGARAYAALAAEVRERWPVAQI